MEIKTALENNKQWVKDKLELDKDYFENLAKGQNPEILYIGCSDSRVTAEELMGAGPGDIFVCRNIANMVLSLDISTASVIDYAVRHLEVKHVVICGHYFCGGVKAAMGAADLGILNPWLRNIRDVYRAHNEELDAITDEDQRYKRLVELNVETQCINLIKKAEIQLGIRRWGLKVHGWVFDIHSGYIVDLQIPYEKILSEIEQVYHIES